MVFGVNKERIRRKRIPTPLLFFRTEFKTLRWGA
jgi:hypothetical protein